MDDGTWRGFQLGYYVLISTFRRFASFLLERRRRHIGHLKMDRLPWLGLQSRLLTSLYSCLNVQFLGCLGIVISDKGWHAQATYWERGHFRISSNTEPEGRHSFRLQISLSCLHLLNFGQLGIILLIWATRVSIIILLIQLMPCTWAFALSLLNLEAIAAFWRWSS